MRIDGLRLSRGLCRNFLEQRDEAWRMSLQGIMLYRSDTAMVAKLSPEILIRKQCAQRTTPVSQRIREYSAAA